MNSVENKVITSSPATPHLMAAQTQHHGYFWFFSVHLSKIKFLLRNENSALFFIE